MKKMFLIFLILSFFLTQNSLYSQSENFQLVYPPSFLLEPFQGIVFTDSLTGYLWTTKKIYKTTNSGVNWELNFSIGFNLSKVYFINADTGFATYSRNSHILRTTNGAQSWQEIHIYSYYYRYEGVSFLNSKTGYIVGGGSTRLDARITTNTGETWSYLTHIDGFYNSFKDVYFRDSSNGFICGDKHFIRTTNGGQSWYSINLGSNPYYKGISFLNQSTGFVSHNSNNVFRTFTSGNSWFNFPVSEALGYVIVKVFSADAVFALSRNYEIFKSTNLGSQWIKKNSETYFPTHRHLTGIDFYNDSNGYAVGSEAIYKSTNKGDTWSFYFDYHVLNSMKARSAQDIIAVGNEGVILRSQDFGENWAKLNNPFTVNLNYIDFDNSDYLIAGDSGYIFYSSNSTNWYAKKLSTNSKLLKVIPTENHNFAVGENGTIFFSNKDTNWINISPFQYSDISFHGAAELNNSFYAVGDSGTLIKSYDKGINWINLKFHRAVKLNDIKFTGENKGFMAVNGSPSIGSIYVTNDQGYTWDSVHVSRFSSAHEIHFFNENTGYFLGYPNNFLTTNGGLTWNRNLSYFIRAYNCILNLDTLFALKFGERDRILRTTNFFQSFIPVNISSISNEIPEKYLLSTYPNPFNPTSKINFTLYKSEFVSLKIYDLSGREIANLYNDKLNAGTHEILFSADEYSLSSGLYIVVMRTENSLLTSKMILVR